MDNIRKSIEILFKTQNPEEILSKYFDPLNEVVFSERINKENFQSFFSFQYKDLYNKDEIANVINLLESDWNEVQFVEQKNFFNTLAKFTEKVLVEKNGEPLCDYEHLLRWRELSFQLGEDLFTTAYFAMKDFQIGRERSKFAWRPIVSTNNTRIKELLKKGLAENHFHLKGSAPHFQLNWLSLMNNICNRDEEFQWIYTQKKLSPTIKIGFETENQDFQLLVEKAAAIRCYLAQKYILEENQKNTTKDWELLENILKSKDKLEIDLYKSKLQTNIDSLKSLKGKRFGDEIPDYMIPINVATSNYNEKSRHYNGNILLYGERFFLYKILKRIYSGDKKLKKEKDLLYIYILIKQKFRSEMIQNNRVVGFGNFGNYQDRKGTFLKNSVIYNKAIVNMAINASMIDQNIKFLEARIAPEKTSIEYDEVISEYDNYVKSEDFYDVIDSNLQKLFEINNLEEISKEDEYFYNVHFIKIPEIISQNKEDYYKLELYPRNYMLRLKIKEQAKKLNEFRKSKFRNASRILGIDAANTEIGCRPEIFGQIFRYLKNYSYEPPLSNLGKNTFKELGISYHVGEDFLDLGDGLRAIDEAVRFLNLTYGDRLGHALALGISVNDYYRSKGYTIIAPKQDLLDNIVWLLAKIREYGIETTTMFINSLENKYRKYLVEIYPQLNYSYHDYYEGWKLRGDSPEVYQDLSEENNYKVSENILSFFERCGLNNYQDTKLARQNKNAVKFYQKYHFDADVKQKGSKVDEFKIEFEYINIIKKIQLKLQEEIARKNIFIETNPSSNYLIGTIKKYCEHPILNFYNLGLGNLCNCHQISVSINTDDQGVFSTYLENEYALMALALEKQKDEEGNYIYNQTMIYEWLDKIRQMGLEQSFINRN
ncbi:MAG: hypothetical protein ACRDDK_00195 [Cetobacterium sp.]